MATATRVSPNQLSFSFFSIGDDYIEPSVKTASVPAPETAVKQIQRAHAAAYFSYKTGKPWTNHFLCSCGETWRNHAAPSDECACPKCNSVVDPFISDDGTLHYTMIEQAELRAFQNIQCNVNARAEVVFNAFLGIVSSKVAAPAAATA